MKHLIVFFSKLCLITAFVLLLLTPRQSAFAACAKSWNNSAGGSWSDGTKWTPNGAPGVSDDVCISLDGTYTVTLSGDTTINSLTVGGGSGTQTLSLQASLTASHGIANAGTIRFDNNSTLTVSSGSTLTNSAPGVINVNFVTAVINADLINNGTISIHGVATLSRTGGVYTNNGTLTVVGSSHLTMSGSSQTFNQNGGTLTVDDWGTFDISNATFAVGGGTITTGAGTGLGLSSAALNFGTGATGSGTIHVNGTSTLSGAVPSGFTVVIGNTSTSSLTAASGFTNSGTILLTSGGCSNDATLAVTSGTLVNAGALNVDICGTATLAANLTNNGTMSIHGVATVSQTNGVHTNNGDITVASSSHLYIAGLNQTFSSPGTFSGNGTLHINNGASYSGTGAISTYVVNHGQMGVGGASTGILNITNTDGSAYTQGADGTLNVRIGGHTPGTGFDQLHIAGGASLDGTLNVSTIGGFSPNLGDSFQIASCHNCNGNFATVNGAVLSACSQFAVQYANTSVTLVTESRPCAFLPFIGK